MILTTMACDLRTLDGRGRPSLHRTNHAVSPDELKITSEPLAQGAAAIILYRQVDRDDNIQTGHEDNYIRIKILTEERRKYWLLEPGFAIVTIGGDCGRQNQWKSRSEVGQR